MVTAEELSQAVAEALERRVRALPSRKPFMWDLADATGRSLDTAERLLKGQTQIDGAVLLSMCQHLGPAFVNEVMGLIGYVAAPAGDPGDVPDALKLRQARDARDKIKRHLACLDKALGDNTETAS